MGDLNNFRQALLRGRNIMLQSSPEMGGKIVIERLSQELGYSFHATSVANWKTRALDKAILPLALANPHGPPGHCARPDLVSPAKVLYFEDLNRASPGALDLIDELARFQSISGKPLPGIHSIIGATNPADTTGTLRVNSALEASFDLFVRVSPQPDRDVFVYLFGPKAGHALVDWWEHDLNAQQQQQVSNLRLEQIGLCAEDGLDTKPCVPLTCEWPIHLLIGRMHGNHLFPKGKSGAKKLLPPNPVNGKSINAQVFISAHHADYPHAEQLYAFLTGRGQSVFFCEKSLPLIGDADYGRAIHRGLDSAKHLVVVASRREHVRTRWVEHEWRFFLKEVLAGRKTGNLLTLSAGSLASTDLPPELRNLEIVPSGPGAHERVWQYVKP